MNKSYSADEKKYIFDYNNIISSEYYGNNIWFICYLIIVMSNSFFGVIFFKIIKSTIINIYYCITVLILVYFQIMNYMHEYDCIWYSSNCHVFGKAVSDYAFYSEIYIPIVSIVNLIVTIISFLLSKNVEKYWK